MADSLKNAARRLGGMAYNTPMAKKRTKKRPKGRKLRVDFTKNREKPGRRSDWTRRFEADEDALHDERAGETVRAKGALSRKRTIVVDQDNAPSVDQTQWKRGVVTIVHGLICRVDDEQGGSWDCTVRRILRTRQIEHRSAVTVGDRVWLSDQSGAYGGEPVGVIERVDERTTSLSRRDGRGRGHLIVANAEQLLIVSSVFEPRLKPHLIDRYIVAAVQGDLRPLICLNKIDLWDESEASAAPSPDAIDAAAAADAESDAEDAEHAEDAESDNENDAEEADGALTPDLLAREFRDLGYTCLHTSAEYGTGLDELRAELKDRITVLSGQSGVGKSSLINALQPGLKLKTREVSDGTEKGRHTTSHASLLRLDFGGYVVDTPGIRGFDLWDVAPGELEACFTEFLPYIQQCRFNDCMHDGTSAGCAVITAMEAGEISPRRYYSYLKMFEEMSAGQ